MASEAIALVDDLVKAKIPKKTATKLIDFVEKHQSQELKHKLDKIESDINWLKWVVGLGFTLIFTIMIYLHSDTGKRIDKIENKVEGIETKVNSIDKKLNQVINLIKK